MPFIYYFKLLLTCNHTDLTYCCFKKFVLFFTHGEAHIAIKKSVIVDNDLHGLRLKYQNMEAVNTQCIFYFSFKVTLIK